MEQGNYAGVDASTARRLKRGDYPIDRRLDLHGLDRVEAHDALRAAVDSAYHAGDRCLLVITGKGRGEGEGILKTSLPGWLGELKSRVLAFEVATQRHGGSGAFYVLVKRNRMKGTEERSDD